MPELKGTVVHIGEVNQITDSFSKQEIVLEYAENPDYPEQVIFEFQNQNINKLLETAEGEEVTIHYNLRGREWLTAPKEKGRRWFNTLVGWKIDINRSSPTYNPPANTNSDPGEEDDLPF